MNNSGGKGSGRRPSQVSEEELNNNWNRIFGKKTKEDSSTVDLSGVSHTVLQKDLANSTHSC